MGDRLVMAKCELETVECRVEEPLEREEEMARVKAIQAGIVTGLLCLTMVRRDALRKHAVSVICIRRQQMGNLATCPLRVKREQAYNTEVVDKFKVIWSYKEEINEEYSCFVVPTSTRTAMGS